RRGAGRARPGRMGRRRSQFHNRRDRRASGGEAMNPRWRKPLLVLAVIIAGMITAGDGSPLIVLVFLFFLAFALLATIKPASQTTVAFAINLWRFLKDFAVDMIVSNFRMAHDVLTP